MKKFLIQFVIVICAIGFTLGINAVVFAASNTGADPAAQLEEILGQGKTGLSNFDTGIHKLSSTEPGADIITSVLFKVIDFLKYLVGAVAVLFAMVTGIKLIASGKKIDEVSEKQKESLKYIIYGLVLIITADELVTRVFFGDYGECIASVSNVKECAQTGGSLVKGIYSLVLALMSTIAIFYFVLSAFRLVTAYGNEETIKQEKQRMMMSIVGLLIAGLGEFVVKKIIFPDSGTKGIDVAAAQDLVYNFTNFIAAFIGVAAFGMMFYGGWLYVSSFGNDEATGKAKKIIIGAVIGILIALAAFGIVRTITTLSTGREEMNLPSALPGLPQTPK
ncbi:MAG: hypothetical protein WCT53_02590 [Candidatus Gracilibacteria bacterium]|jgi:TRAP-type C4-dicarboxylate transport system permease small subunit